MIGSIKKIKKTLTFYLVVSVQAFREKKPLLVIVDQVYQNYMYEPLKKCQTFDEPVLFWA